MNSSLDEEDLAAHGHKAWARFTDAYEALQKRGSAFSEQLDAAAFRAEMQRFQLWAINLGLYRQDHNSLDYRLRDNEVVRSLTEELLASLIEAIGEIISIVSQSDDGPLSISSITPDPDATTVAKRQPSDISSDEESSSSSVIMGALNDESGSMLTLHFEDVTEAVSQLYNLASQIHSPRTRKYRTDVDLYRDVDDEIKSEYIRIKESYELQGIEQILLHSRKLLTGSQTEETSLSLIKEDECLLQRLQKANHARRQQFEYWRRSKKRSVRAASKAMKMTSVAIGDDDSLKRDTPTVVQPSEVTRSLLSSVPALPKDFVLEHKKSTYTGTSRGLTVHGPSGEKVNWPKCPIASAKGEDFECPFCFYLCGPKYSEDAAWRSHLMHDLRPYVCTYNECTEPNVLFESWEEWTRHEQWAHQQRVWRCSEHSQHEYVDLASYKDHVKSYHAASKHQLLSSELLRSQESVSQTCDRPCPFCHREYERPIDLQQHIAAHLESIALLALPNLDTFDENLEAGQVNSNSANRNYAESRAGDFDSTELLLFLENDHSGDTSVTTEKDKETFELKLEAENVSFDSRNEVNVEARQAYSSDLVGEWLSRPPLNLTRKTPLHYAAQYAAEEGYRKFVSDFLESEYPGDQVGAEIGKVWDNSSSSESSPEGKRPVDDQIVPVSTSKSLEAEGSSEPRIRSELSVNLSDQQGTNSIHHWLPEVLSQSSPTTPLEDTDGSSECLGVETLGVMAKLEYSYVILWEYVFDNGGLHVRLYQRPTDGRCRLLCYTTHSEKGSCEPLYALSISRSGSFLKLSTPSLDPESSWLWARFKFAHYERLVLFYCSFLALRFEDPSVPFNEISDVEFIRNERELFAALIVDDHYENALRLFWEEETGVLRLQASVHTGELKKKPIWTAFITYEIGQPGWASCVSSKEVLLANLQQFIFTTDYIPQKPPKGEFKLVFLEPGDCQDFMETVEALKPRSLAYLPSKVD